MPEAGFSSDATADAAADAGDTRPREDADDGARNADAADANGDVTAPMAIDAAEAGRDVMQADTRAETGVDASSERSLDASIEAGDDTEAGIDPRDSGEGGIVLSDVCSDDEWRAITKPLALVTVAVTATDRFAMFVTDIDGRCRRFLEPGSVVLSESPDGRAAFWAVEPANGLRIATVGEIGTPAKLPISETWGSAWSPDSRWLAVIASRDGSTAKDLYAVRADGTAFRKIAADVDPDAGIAWSPDSSQLAFVGPKSNPGVERLGIDCPDRDCLRLMSAIASVPWNPAWSPDGTRIAIRALSTMSRIDIYIADATSGDVKQISSGTVSNEEFARYAWSKAGDRLFYESETFNGDFVDVGVLCADGTCRKSFKPLIARSFDQFWGLDAQWSPDDSRVAFTVSNQSEPFVLSACADATCVSEIGPSAGFVWSHDGSYLLHSVRDEDAGSYSIVASCKDGSCTHRLGPGPGGGTTGRLSHSGGALAFQGEDAVWVADGIQAARRVSATNERVPDDWLSWSRDDRYLVYAVGHTEGLSAVPDSVRAVCADGSCRSVAVPAAPPGTRDPILEAVLAPPSP
jgi:Tol biopolymer transport system component